jgi:putative restriction endonuclease
MCPRPSQYGQAWTHDELVLAFDLYCRIPFKATKASNPAVVELAKLLSRSPAAVARKLGNFGAFDPELHKRNIVGLIHGSKLDREVWDEFHRDWAGLVEKASILRREVQAGFGHQAAFSDGAIPQGPSERVGPAKHRLHQSFFREAVLSSYEDCCCVTGLSVRETLIASHIVPWSQNERLRADPTNGLCLSATFDRLFDAGLFTIERDLRIRFSTQLLDRADEAVSMLLAPYHERVVRRPARFVPSEECLRWHRENIFRG